jgi:hypothetical protein
LIYISYAPMQVNDYLWLLGDSVPEEQFYHRTRTICY